MYRLWTPAIARRTIGVPASLALTLCAASAILPAPTVTAAETPIDEIVVTGQKRKQSLRDVNASVAVFDAELINDLTFTDVSELYQYTPNVQNTVADEGDFNIRGINFRGENLSLTSNVGSLYVDGIFQSTLGIEAGPSGIFDVAQVEIYRGAQSTIQGRNALAGVVMIRTADPSYEWEVKGRAETADYDSQRYALAVGGGLIEDQLAFRASWDDYESDGFLDNPAAGIDDMNFDDARNRRAKLLFEPRAIEGFSALLTYVDSEGLAGTGFGTNVANGPDFFDRNTRADITNPGVLEIQTENWAAELRQEVNDRLTLEFIATRSDAEEDSRPRFEAFDLDVFFDFATDEETVDTAELRGVWTTERMRLIAGLYRFEQDRDRKRDLGLLPSNIYFVEGTRQQIDNSALYFDGELSLAPAWTLLFGARYDSEEYTESGFSQFSVSGPIDAASLASNLTDTDYDAFLPKLGMRWAQSPDLVWSLVAQRGYRAGGASIDGDNLAYEFDPEYTNNVELALRSQWFDGRMTLNANLFYVDWEDQQVLVQVGDPAAMLFRTDNAGESELYGLEVDVRARLGNRLTLLAGLGLLHTEFEDFANAATGEDFSGNRFSQAPEQSLNVGLLYEHGNGVYAALDARYQSDSYSEAANVDAHEVDGYVVANAKLGFRSQRWSASLFARNLFDEDYLLRVRNVVGNADPLAWEANVGAPRVIGGELTFSL